MNGDSKVELIITARERDIGGLTVRRVLPYAARRMVGPIIFFDHMGPAEFKPGEGMDVRPHPHINLATVTYLFEGKIRHQDSLGTDQMIEPGAINWMSAGRGIVHSERTPQSERILGTKLDGIQLWVGLPDEFEEGAPSFSHHPKDTLPEFMIGNVRMKLLLGRGFDRQSPVPVVSDMIYAEAHIPRGAPLDIPVGDREIGIYVVSGEVQLKEQTIQASELGFARDMDQLRVHALQDVHIMILGGQPLGPRHLYWNFASSSKDRVEEAKELWRMGPSRENPRFAPIPGDNEELIPLPAEPGLSKPTIM